MNLSSNKDCLEQGQQKPADYLATYTDCILYWEKEAAEAIESGDKVALSMARCRILRLKELSEAFELRNKDPRLLTDEEINSQLEPLESRRDALRAERQRRHDARKARANNELGAQTISHLEGNRAARAEMAEQSATAQRAEKLPPRFVVIAETREERLARLEKITGPLPKI